MSNSESTSVSELLAEIDGTAYLLCTPDKTVTIDGHEHGVGSAIYAMRYELMVELSGDDSSSMMLCDAGICLAGSMVACMANGHDVIDVLRETLRVLYHVYLGNSGVVVDSQHYHQNGGE